MPCSPLLCEQCCKWPGRSTQCLYLTVLSVSVFAAGDVVPPLFVLMSFVSISYGVDHSIYWFIWLLHVKCKYAFSLIDISWHWLTERLVCSCTDSAEQYENKCHFLSLFNFLWRWSLITSCNSAYFVIFQFIIFTALRSQIHMMYHIKIQVRTRPTSIGPRTTDLICLHLCSSKNILSASYGSLWNVKLPVVCQKLALDVFDRVRLQRVRI